MQPLLPHKTEIPDASRAEDSAIMQLSENLLLPMGSEVS